jgi:hypothetical protein
MENCDAAARHPQMQQFMSASNRFNRYDLNPSWRCRVADRAETTRFPGLSKASDVTLALTRSSKSYQKRR